VRRATGAVCAGRQHHDAGHHPGNDVVYRANGELPGSRAECRAGDRVRNSIAGLGFGQLAGNIAGNRAGGKLTACGGIDVVRVEDVYDVGRDA